MDGYCESHENTGDESVVACVFLTVLKGRGDGDGNGDGCLVVA